MINKFRVLYKYGVLLSAVSILASCNKEDKKGGDITDQLKNKYCNIPSAINYNWGFPGVADNSICYFATDYYIGDWTLIDTVRLEDSSIVRVDTLSLRLEKVANDTTNSLLHLQGWCAGSNILLNVNKFYIGITDTFQNSDGWQLVCNNTDSLKINFTQNLMDSTLVDFNIRQYKNDTLFLHQAIATKN